MPQTQSPPLNPEIRRLLAAVRWRIRVYTLVQGVALIVCWLAAMFWLALALDYGPVLMWATEMPLGVRVGILVIVGLGVAHILYHWIFRRTFARLADHSMAVLLERQHDDFHDSLLTAVELHEHPDHAEDFNPDMLDHTGTEAVHLTSGVRPGRVFRYQPLVIACTAAVLLGGSVALLAALPKTRDVFDQAKNRLVFLSDEAWDRKARLEVLHVKTQTIDWTPPEETADGDAGVLIEKRPKIVPSERPFIDGTVRVARGSDVQLVIAAHTAKHTDPGSVQFYWNSPESGDRGKHRLTDGRRREGQVLYTHAGDPLNDIQQPIRFGVRGLDFRAQWYDIEVVPTPVVTEVEVIYDRPTYLVDESRDMFRRVNTPLVPGMQVPKGSRVTLTGKSNKPLSTVYIYDVHAEETTEMSIDDEASQFEYVVDYLEEPIALEVWLVDTDGLILAEPHTIGISVQEDDPPDVAVAFRGIGSAITPDVKFRVGGRVTDDNWLQRTWLNVVIKDGKVHELPLTIEPGGLPEAEIEENELPPASNLHQWVDIRDERAKEVGAWELTPGQQIAVTVSAADLYDLENFDPKENPHAGSGETINLDVVSADDLLKLLERRELGLRQRLEQVLDELTQMRESLDRVRRGEAGKEEVAAREPGDSNVGGGAEPGDEQLTPEEQAERAAQLRQLWVKAAVRQSAKSRDETEGVAVSLLDIAAELENNRVDAEDRQQRLTDQVATPLLAIVADDFTYLDEQLATLESHINDPQRSAEEVAAAATASVEQTEAVILALDEVLQKMLDLESFNEIVDLVRAILEDQDDLTKETEKVRGADFFDDF